MTAARPTSRHGQPGWPELAARMLGAAWRWRVELGLLALFVIAWRLLAGAVGAVAGALLVAWVAAGVLAAPAARNSLARLLRERQTRRRFRRARIHAGLPLVALGRLQRVPAGEATTIRVASGGSIADVDAVRERLAASIGLRELRVWRDPADASRGTVTFVRRDPLAGTGSVTWPHADAARLSLWDPIPIGVDELDDAPRLGAEEAIRAARQAPCVSGAPVEDVGG